MAQKNNNSYAKKAAKSKLMAGLKDGLPTKGNAKNTLVETGKDLVVGVIAGGLVGAAIGKPSLLVGLAVTGMGHFTGHRLASLFGMGIMAANGFQSKSVSGVDGLSADAVKERLTIYKDSFAQKLYLDKMVGSKAGTSTTITATTNGIGELQLFNYPNDMNGAVDELSGELSALSSIERQIEESAAAQMQMAGSDAIDGTGLSDVSDLNF